MISASSRKSSEVKHEISTTNLNLSCKPTQCDQTQLPRVGEKANNNDKSFNKKPSTEYKEKKPAGDAPNNENDEEGDELGKV